MLKRKKCKEDDFAYVTFECNCCGKSTRVVGTLNSPLSYFYFVAFNRGFHMFDDDVCLCPQCINVFDKINK